MRFRRKSVSHASQVSRKLSPLVTLPESYEVGTTHETVEYPNSSKRNHATAYGATA